MPRATWPTVVLLGVIAGMPAGGAVAAEAPPSAGPNTLQAIDYALLPAGGALVKAVFARPLPAPPSLLVNHYPSHRIALDFPDTVSAAGESWVVVEVSVYQFSRRLVLSPH